MILFPRLCVTALRAILVVFHKLALLFNTLAPGLLWIGCSAYCQAASLRKRSSARQLLSALCCASWGCVIFSSLYFFIVTFPVSSYVFLQRGVKPFVTGKGAEPVPEALPASENSLKCTAVLFSTSINHVRKYVQGVAQKAQPFAYEILRASCALHHLS